MTWGQQTDDTGDVCRPDPVGEAREHGGRYGDDDCRPEPRAPATKHGQDRGWQDLRSGPGVWWNGGRRLGRYSLIWPYRDHLSPVVGRSSASVNPSSVASGSPT